MLGELLTSGSRDSLVGLLPAFAKLANHSREILEVKEEWAMRQIRSSRMFAWPIQTTDTQPYGQMPAWLSKTFFPNFVIIKDMCLCVRWCARIVSGRILTAVLSLLHRLEDSSAPYCFKVSQLRKRTSDREAKKWAQVNLSD